MRIPLPSNLQYPIKVHQVNATPGTRVKIHDPLFTYSYTVVVKQQVGRYDDTEEEVKKEFDASFESPVEGVVGTWLVWNDDLLRGPRDVCEIIEDCKHSVVFNEDKKTDQQSSSDSVERSNATVKAAHGTDKLLISGQEASEADEVSKKRLLSARKLSLVVDLDQTIIHAAVDPTIGEWQKDPENPNFEALKDVRAFQLQDDAQGTRSCWYYIKLRPGLEQFLESVSDRYELHIYTMGTRQYAQQIAKIVDPDRKYFEDRILSRDESGSIVAKNLTRIFPVDTKMVVIIDDRGDVWKWSPNLVRVNPFDFFLGIGDINSDFLPKKQEIPSTPQNGVEEAVKNDTQTHSAPTDEELKTNGHIATQETPGTDTSALQQVLSMSGDEGATGEMTKSQEETIATQLEEKPLLKLQQQLDEKDGTEDSVGSVPAIESPESDSSDSDTSTSGKGKRHAILRNDDEELVHLERSLNAVHEKFFAEYDRKRGHGSGGRVAALAGKRKEPLPEQDDSATLRSVPDVKQIIPAMKRRVMDGIVIVFSGVVPLSTDIHSADIAIWARSFGARVADKVSKEVTHVVAARIGTSKVKTAVRRGIPVVGTQWLIHSFQRWKRQDEGAYLIKDIGQKEHERGPSSEVGDPDPDFLGEKRLGEPNDHLLSSEDDASGANETDDDKEDRSAKQEQNLEVDLPEGDFDYDLNHDSSSPVDLTRDEWQEMQDELAEFMGSDLDSESDAESVQSDRLTSRPAKKRSRDDIDNGDSEHDTESDSETTNGDHKRHKGSRHSGSSLKAVSNVEALENSTSTGHTQQDEDDNDDDLARELELELEAAQAEEDAAAQT
ncbi:CTD phosphatase Fcp1 [Lithohypha guttulata]|uniref:RNA polymerase II subunit A C-terminal domain phosphatase n=1 Tax=Lithohypha guttulata TaxID=1690604 RepID=A0AAN7Y4A5_9EURO|nr:CTD phosphatase Fcp1 [Lithohypha guttulata]